MADTIAFFPKRIVKFFTNRMKSKDEPEEEKPLKKGDLKTC